MARPLRLISRVEIFRRIFAVMIGLSVVQIVLYYPQLPDIMASHFDGAGEPNGWMPKTTFFAIHVLMMLLMTLAFIYLPVGLKKLPLGRWNFPHREYWFSPKRYKETMRRIRLRMLIFGIATMFLMLAIIQLAIVANLNAPAVLSPVLGGLLLAYFGFTAAWLVAFYRRFSKASG
jgi:uncharacterized membrane protein